VEQGDGHREPNRRQRRPHGAHRHTARRHSPFCRPRSSCTIQRRARSRWWRSQDGRFHRLRVVTLRGDGPRPPGRDPTVVVLLANRPALYVFFSQPPFSSLVDARALHFLQVISGRIGSLAFRAIARQLEPPRRGERQPPCPECDPPQRVVDVGHRPASRGRGVCARAIQRPSAHRRRVGGGRIPRQIVGRDRGRRRSSTIACSLAGREASAGRPAHSSTIPSAVAGARRRPVAAQRPCSSRQGARAVENRRAPATRICGQHRPAVEDRRRNGDRVGSDQRSASAVSFDASPRFF